MADFNSSLPVRSENAGDVQVKLCDKTTPSQQVAVDSSGNLSVTVQNAVGNPVETRALTNADVVTADQGAASNAAGGWFVRPTDGTNSQAYTATGEAKVEVTQPLPTGTNNIGSVNSNLHDGAGTAVNLGQGLMAASLPVVIASNQTSFPIKLQDGSGTAITSQTSGAQQALDVGINVAGAQVDPRDIRALTATDVVTANIKDATGTAFSTSNPLPVVISNTVPGTEILDYKTAAAVAAGSSDTHTYTVTALKTLSLQQIVASASGKIKVEIKLAGSTKIVLFNSTSEPNVSYTFFAPQAVAAGVAVAVVITNLDKSAMDVYSTIEGVEN
jgi:hypothetical protein